ncbi:hypothetical protein [Paludibacter sp. 221]|uniref:hypothetical protein n=1 Tax=Paludibacter sp. 221 TaxID=2302939 RepID=UPI0013D49E1F|nr:hypothetical protein [Paludibacter sp. 221]
MTANRDLPYENFIEAIKEKIPQRGKLTSLLVDMLCIEKEAVYRRLRNEVPFTFAEIAIIAKELNISLDDTIGAASLKSRPFQLKLTDYYNPTPDDYAMHEEFADLLSVVRNDEYSEVGFAANILPLHFSVKYELIHRFYTLRWLYQFGAPDAIVPFSEIVFEDKMKNLFQGFLNEVEYFKQTFFIFNQQMMSYFCNDINYFYSIRLLTADEVRMLKEELTRFLNHLEQLSIHGTTNKGNKVAIYVSNINFETTYTYLQTSEYKLTMLKTFTLNETTSLDEEVFNRVKTWMHSLKRTSTLISESDERNRILFFERQRKSLEENLSV